jgi:hypothetical protein
MEEANHRVLRPYRMYLPTPSWVRFRSRMAQLNKFLIDLFRWAATLDMHRGSSAWQQDTRSYMRGSRTQGAVAS